MKPAGSSNAALIDEGKAGAVGVHFDATDRIWLERFDRPSASLRQQLPEWMRPAFEPPAACYVYVLSVECPQTGLRAVKVGISRNPTKRATGFVGAKILSTTPCPSREYALAIEQHAHRVCDAMRVPAEEAVVFTIGSARGAGEFFWPEALPLITAVLQTATS